jgi:transposase
MDRPADGKGKTGSVLDPDTTCFVMDPTRAGAARGHRRRDRAAGCGRGRAAAAGDLQRRLLGVHLGRDEGRRAGEPVLLGAYPPARRAGRGREPRSAEVLDPGVAGADQGPVRRAGAAHGRLGRSRRARAADAAARLDEAYAAWDDAPGAIDSARRKQIAAPGLQEPAKKALATLDREWDGLAAHRGYPTISLNNNAAGRALRRPVVTRKNAGGARNEDAAWLAARIWTVTATAEMAGLNVLTYLTAYLDACGRNGGKPLTGPDLERFLPWNAAPADLRPGHSHPRPANPRTATPTASPPRIWSRRLPACALTPFPNTYIWGASGRMRLRLVLDALVRQGRKIINCRG